VSVCTPSVANVAVVLAWPELIVMGPQDAFAPAVVSVKVTVPVGAEPETPAVSVTFCD
jgi:hypothetical protein